MRIGLLGTGPWARSTHGPALNAHPDVELIGVWGRRPEAAAALAEGLGTRPYDDADALLADADAVAIALPPTIQAELAVRAARAGCHLLLDKPVATTVPEARRVVEAADAAGVASVVFFTVRFGTEPGEWIAAQAAAGGWFTGRADWLGSVFSPEPAAEGNVSPYAASPWRGERGALWDVGPHALSVLLPVLGDVAPADVTAARGGSGDTVHLVLRHAGGASSTATLSLTVPPQAAGATAELRGSHGVIVLPPGRDSAVTAFGRAVDALVEAAHTGRAHPCDARFGLRVTEILSAAERSLGA